MRNLIASFVAKPGKAEEVTELIGAYADLVRAERGCLRFEVYRASDDRARFVVVERYADEGAFAQHLESRENALFNSRLGPLVANGGSTVELLDAL